MIGLVDQMEGRRIVAGRLDCPNCEDRHPIVDGVVHLLGSAAEQAGDPVAVAGDVADMSSALLGPPAGPEVLLVGQGLPSLANRLAELRPDAWVISYAAPQVPIHERVHCIVPVVGGPLPLRSARVDGVIMSGEAALDLAEAARVLAPDRRLLILMPGPDVSRAVAATVQIRELAADSRAWLGVRT